jgi:hypothetical membrane protein
MKKVNLKALIVSGVLAAITFIILELLIETAFSKLFHISESFYYEQLGIVTSGTRFHILNFVIFFLEMFIVMYIYALIRPNFKSNISTGIVTSMLFLGLGFLILANFTNLGILTIGMSLTSFFFNVLELTPAVLVGAVTYAEG